MASVISAGTTSGTALNFSGDTSGVLQLASNGTTTALSISTAQVVTLTNALAVTSGGTGVTTSTGTGANVLGTSPTITTPTISSLSSASATALTLQSAGTTAVTIDTSQNVGIGTASPGAKLDVSSTASRIFNLNSTSANGYGMAFNNSGTDVAYIGSAKWTFSGALNDMSITTHGAYNLCFGTNDTERMRIDSSGRLLVGTPNTYNGSCTYQQRSSVDANQVSSLSNSSTTNPYLAYWEYPNISPNNTGSYYLQCSDNAGSRFIFRSNGGLSNYTANDSNLSDRREKTNFAPAKSYLNTICSIPVQTFNYIDQNLEEDDGLTLGVVAQDVQAVAPELVHETDWGTKEEPKMRLSIYQTDLQYALMKSIQELKAINDTQAETINALTARIVALESKA